VIEAPDREATHDLDHYLRPLRRRWRLVLLGIALGAVLGVVAIEAVSPEYTATASILVTPTGVDTTGDNATGRTQGPVNLDTEAQVVRSEAVLLAAREAIGFRASVAALRRRVTVTVPANTTVLEVAYKARSAEEARAGARTLARAYLDNRAASAEAELRKHAASVRGRMDALRQRLRAAASVVASRPPNSAARAFARARMDSYTAQISALASDHDRLTTTIVTPGRVIADPELPAGPSSPIRVVLLASAIMAGLLIGVLAAVVRDRTDPQVRDVAPLDELGVPVLVVASTDGEAANGEAAKGEAANGERDRAPLRAYHGLAHAVFGAFGARRVAVTVAGVSAHQRRTAVADRLTAALTRLHTAVLVQHPGDGAPEAPGEALDHVRVAFVGDALETFDMAQLRSELDGLKEAADVVVVDAPPFIGHPVTEALAAYCDGVILVVEIGVTRLDDLAHAVRQIDVTGGHVLGAAVIRRARAGGRARGDVPDGAPVQPHDPALYSPASPAMDAETGR